MLQNSKMVRLSTVLAVMALAVSAGAATWYVDGSVAANGDGTAASPWKTLQDADNGGVIAPGDTVLVQAGSYAGFLPWISNGTADAHVTWKADGQVYVTGNIDCYADYTDFDGFDVSGGVFGISFYAPYKTVQVGTVRNCVIHDNSMRGIDTYAASGGVFHNNVIYNTRPGSYAAIDIQASTGIVQIFNNTIYNAYVGILFSGNTAMTSDLKNNIIAGSDYGLDLLDGTALTNAYNLYYGNANDYFGLAVQGLGEFNADPLFVDAANKNFRLSIDPLSPAINAGVDVGLPFIVRPDIGYWESDVVPEPSSLAALGFALSGLIGFVVRKRA